MKISRKHILKAWISSLLGLLITVIPTVADVIIDGAVHWKKTGLLLSGTVILSLTDLFKEIKREIDADR